MKSCCKSINLGIYRMKHVIAHRLTSQHFRTEKRLSMCSFQSSTVMWRNQRSHKVCYNKHVAKSIN